MNQQIAAPARNTFQRKALALLSVPLLAVPSAIGVQAFLEPESGKIASWCAAVGFEVLYIGINVLVLHSPELRRYGRNVALAAVVTAVIFNTLAHYGAKVEGAYTDAAFQPLAFMLSLLASVPLAGLAYAVSVLLHRLSDEAQSHEPEAEGQRGATTATRATTVNLQHQQAHLPVAELVAAPESAQSSATATSYARITEQPTYPLPVAREVAQVIEPTSEARRYPCPSCSEPLSLGMYGAAKRRGYCRTCKTKKLNHDIIPD